MPDFGLPNIVPGDHRGGGNCHWVSRVKFKAELRETVRTVRNRKVIPSANPTKSGTTNPTMYYVYTITL